MSTIEQARSAILLNNTMFKRDFFDWITANHQIFSYFEQSAQKVREAGFNHYSARTIVEVMRHRTNVREIGDGTWKINDHRTPDMARLYMLLHPKHQGLFEFRVRKAPHSQERIAA